MKSRAVPKTIDEYIAGYPVNVQPLLKKIRATINTAAPGAEEKISYQIPAFKQSGHYLIYFAAFKKHVGVYPAPISHPDFKDALAPYASGKATVQFAYDKPIPYGIITKIVKFKLKENLDRATAKATSNP